MSNDPVAGAESKVERAKRASRHLRGTLAETLASGATHFGGDDAALLKFHGSYQQDDRDARRASESGDKAWQFMVRIALPGGGHTAAQYLAFDRLAARYGNETLRITTRQGYQLHGVLAGNLKPTIAAINAELATTLAACGDVQRNVMACPAPLDDPAHAAVRTAARDLADALRPATRAYHEIWLDGEPVHQPDGEEPFYGSQYLPRKFKVAVSLPGDNCVDVYSQDVGLVAVLDQGVVTGWHVLVGGGLGMTHGKADTMATLGQPLGRVEPGDAVAAVRAVAAVYRDHGNRADRRHARLKYLLAAWGLPRFRDAFLGEFRRPLHPSAPTQPSGQHDHLGPWPQGDGRWFYGLHVAAGRIRDAGPHRLRSALAVIASDLAPAFVLTPQQNLLLTNLSEDDALTAERILAEHGVPRPRDLAPLVRHSLACPALPTCSLAIAESERALPGVLDILGSTLQRLGLADRPLAFRITGCPNGCARPYTADLALVGRSPGLYHVYVGGHQQGDRLADLFLADVRLDDLARQLEPLLARWAAHGGPQESLGAYYQRLRGNGASRSSITGRETPTAVSLGLLAS